VSSVRPSQDDGRWWWDAAVGLVQQDRTSLVAGTSVAGYDQRDLRLSAGLNGYIYHPRIASFRLTTDLLLSNIEGRDNFDSDTYGLGAELNTFPRGGYPFSLYYRKNL
jgi:hypothetical protein